MNTWNINDTEQVLKMRLEQERAAGIPSIPESLKPEKLEALLKQKEKTGKRYRIPGSKTAMAAAAVLLLIILPVAGGGGKEAATSNQAAPSSTMAAASNSMAGSGNMEIMEETRAEAAMEYSSAVDAACGVATEEIGIDTTTESETEIEMNKILLVDGSYEASCIDEDTLYLLQKTDEHELYIISLSEPSEWQKVFPEIPPEEEITAIEIKEQEIIFYNETGISYNWLLNE